MNHVFKTFTSALLGAAALASLATGCVREEFSNNPNYNPEKNSVTTKFVLNVSNQTGNDTKMTAANVQANGQEFLGMQDVHILTYKLGDSNTPKTSGEGAWAAPTTEGRVGKFFFNPVNTTATEDYNFGRLFDAGTITDSKQSRVMELSFPLETNAVVLYGKAINTLGPEYQGAVTLAGDPTNLASIRFGLTPRIDKAVDRQYKAYKAGAYALQSVLSSLTIAGLVNEKEYWTDDGNIKTASNHYQVMGNDNKQYKIWLPYEPNDDLYKKLVQTNRYSKVVGTETVDYVDGEAYVPISGDPPSQYTYRLKVGNCSWKMLGDMYAAKHDGDNTTKVDEVCGECDPHTYATDIDHVVTEPLSFVPLLESLGEAYYKLITIAERTETIPDPTPADANHTKQITYHELRSGSAAGILRTLRDLDFILHKAMDSSPSSWGEVIAQQLATEIHTRMEAYFTGEKDGLVYRSANDIRSKLATYSGTTDDYINSGIATYFSDEYLQGTSTTTITRDGTAGFPMNIGLPMGAAYLETDVKGTVGEGPWYFKAPRFLFKEDIPAYAFGSDNYFNIFDYCYPAELMYYGNSPLRISTAEHTEAQYPATLTEWRNDSSEKWTGWTKFAAVTSETRSVAMVDHINYGSALLKSTIKYENGLTALKDNNSAIHKNESDNTITLDATHGLTVTGIVIGGQPAAVTWDYTRMPDYAGKDANNNPIPPDYTGVTYTGGKFDGLHYTKDQFGKMIYDQVQVTDRFRIDDTNNHSIYTICWDNYDAENTADDQRDVYIALELRNDTNQDFWGETNLIRKNAIFYIVGKLDLKKLITNYNENITNNNTALNTGGYETILEKLANRSKTGYYYYPPFNPVTGETIAVPRVFMQDFMTDATLVLKQDCLKHAYMTVPDLRSNQVSLGVSVDVLWEDGLSFEVEMGKLN